MCQNSPFNEFIFATTICSEDDFYLKGSKIAYKQAKKLATGLEKRGYHLAYPFESNQVFVKVADTDISHWKEISQFEIMEEKDSYHIVRLVTTFRTSDAEVEGFLNEI